MSYRVARPGWLITAVSQSLPTRNVIAVLGERERERGGERKREEASWRHLLIASAKLFLCSWLSIEESGSVYDSAG